MEETDVVSREPCTCSLQELEESPSRNKKPKLVAYESSEDESSILVVEDDNCGSIVDSLDVRRRQLLEIGCSIEQVAHAIEICGKNAEINDMFDFIQATSYDTLSEGCTSNVPTLKVLEDGNCGSIVDTLDVRRRQLLEIGCSIEQVAHAIEICGRNAEINDMFDFIQANSYNTLSESCTSNAPTLKEDSIEDQEDIELTPFQHLENMGFSSSATNNAMETCESLDIEVLLSFLLQAEKNNLPHGEDLQLEESGQELQAHVDYCKDEEDIEFIPFKRLKKMGYSSSVIKNAMETCESLDLDDLLSFIFETEKDNFPYGEDLQKEESDKKSCVSEETLRAKVIYEAGPSRTLSTPVTWTRERTRLWYTYLGLKQDFFSDPGSFGSGKKMSALKLNNCKEKSFVFKPQRGDVFVPEKMMGFSIPGCVKGRPQPLPEIMAGPPYFYFENVAGAPKSEWETIRRHLHGVDIEYTDSKFFSATRRPRGYVHNIPIDNRKHIMPEPPMTIFEALPNTEKYWPHWDTRDKLNCINTHRASDSLCEMIRSFFEEYGELEMPCARQQEILQACKRWNLVWVGPGQAAGLEPHEMELLLGFDRDHTRGCSSMTDRYAALGNTFQVNTVAYHLSPLKGLYPKGITVLSLFSGIGGAEVALHKSGIILKAVVAVESNVKASNSITSWWKKTGQRGTLKHLHDVRDLTYEVISGLIDEFGKIDLIIGGSPCNNLSGCNRVSRVGLDGKESSLFFEYPRILTLVKMIMTERGYI